MPDLNYSRWAVLLAYAQIDFGIDQAWCPFEHRELANYWVVDLLQHWFFGPFVCGVAEVGRKRRRPRLSLGFPKCSGCLKSLNLLITQIQKFLKN